MDISYNDQSATQEEIKCGKTYKLKRFSRQQQLDMLRNLVSLFFVQIGDEDWINSRKI